MTQKVADAIVKRYGKRTFEMYGTIYLIVGYQFYLENGILELGVQKVKKHNDYIGTQWRFYMELHNYFSALGHVRFHYL